MIMSITMPPSKKGVTRRGFLTVAISAIVAGVVSGIGSYYAGLLGAPAQTVTVAGPERTITMTTTVTTTVTSPAKPAPEYFVVGLVGPLTGPAADWGRDFLDGATLAVEKINREGGVYVREFGKKIPIKLTVGDDKNSVTECLTAVKRLIAEKVDVLVGPISSAAMYAVQPLIVEAGIPYIFIGVSILSTTRKDIDTWNTFHYQATPHAHQAASCMFLTKVFKPKLKLDRKVRLVVLMQDSPVGQGHKEALEMLLKARHDISKDLEVVEFVPYPVAETTFHPYLLKCKEAKPDVVYIAGHITEVAAALIQGLRDVKLNTLYIAEPCCEDWGYYRLVGKWGDRQCLLGIPMTTVKPPPTDHHAKFVEEFEKRFGYTPGIFAICGHDPILIFKDAVERVGSLDKRAIIAGLHSTDLPQLGFMIKGGRLRFTDIALDAGWPEPIPRSIWVEEAMLQQFWDEKEGIAKPYIVYHPTLKAQKEFELPPGYTTYY